MSRIVVKNLPKKITAEKLQELFSSKGHVTDVQLKYAASGVFRHFAFIGFRTEEEAKEAQKYFHNTFIQTSKIKVEMCHPLGGAKQAWSKYSKQVSKKRLPEKKPTKENVKELKQDSQLSEYLEVTGDRKSKPSWRDHAVELEDASVKKKEESHGNGDSSDSDGDDEISDDSDAPPQEHMSDMEYLKSKIKTSQNIAGDGKSLSKQKKKKAVTKMFTVKLKKLPYSCKKKHLKAFFLPLKPKSIRIPRGKKGFAYVGFSEEKDMKKALNKNRGFLEGHRVDVLIYHQKAEEIIPQEVVKEVESHESKESSSEIIAETGRLFVRNLCFTVTEEELNELFSKYGSIAEIHIPTDFYTKQGLGYAFVSYVFAEHAVEAFTKLDGSIFQGRLLHIIPGKHKKEVILDPKEMTFKEKKAEKVKFMAQSSHTWNSLFLGFDAVSTIISERYKVPKAELLNPETPDSVAVRMALAETQLVLETKQFLLTHGIKLDAFGQSDAERSKTVVLAKNLPANTTSDQVLAVFSRHGSVKKVLLPPSGVTAIVEFSLPSEAKTAFKKLAHSRFVNQVLFLEWAPVDVFCNEIQEDAGVTKEKGTTESLPLEAEQKEEDGFHQEETTIFVKNLNFETSEEDLKKHFKTCGPVHSVSIAKKPDLKTGNLLSMGFGFVTYKDRSSARTALNDLQFSRLDGHTLQLMFSNRTKQPAVATNKRKKSQATEQSTSKICVRNIPFGITQKEVESLFREFGELKFVRLPKRSDGIQGHRGFGFVDFFDKNCAKRAFDALCQSTHLLGRRLVLEWALPDSEDLTDLRKDTARKFYLQSSSEKRTKKRKLREDALLA